MPLKTKLTSYLTASALIITLSAGTAIAQKGPLKFDLNGDQQISITEFLAGADTRFDETDVNGDGFLSDDERKASREARRQAHADERFAKVDQNGDGQLSKEELQAAKDARRDKKIARHDLNGDGTVDDQEREALKAQKSERRAEGGKRKRGERVNPDANDDGFISRDEHTAAANKMFEFLDANADGVLTEGEGKKRKGKKGKRKGFGS